MKKLLVGLSVFIAVVVFSVYSYITPTKATVRKAARAASVQPMFYHPVLKVSFVDIEEEENTPISEIIDKKIKSAIEAERELRKAEQVVEEKYEQYLTTTEVYGMESPSRTDVPLGSIPGVPEWAMFPERVLVVCKVEENEINPYDEESEGDVKIVSETANTSLSNAKDILAKLRADGYRIAKDEISVDETVELLHFSDGWQDGYPDTLQWKVYIEGSENNLITGYDPRGILKVSPIPEDSRIYVKAGYYDLKDEHKPVSDEIQDLRDELKYKKEEIETLKEEIKELTPEEDGYKRDITKVTYFDLMAGRITLENFWIMSGGSGVLLGNYNFGENTDAYHSRRYGVHDAVGGMRSLVLTNAHVAVNAVSGEMMVNNDNTVMYIIYPGRPYIRHTATSDRMGSPAAVLILDGDPVISPSIDAAVMVTSLIPGTDRAARLGDSDKVRVGEPVISVGNPMLMSKFTTEGVISNKNYNLLQSPSADYIFPYIRSGTTYDGLVSSCFWLDTPIGIGGVSGSGIFSLKTGKVVALRNSGMASKNRAMFMSEVRKVENIDIPYDTELSKIGKEHTDSLFENYPMDEARFTDAIDGDFGELYDQSSGYSRVAGMNIGIPVNLIKAFLQERGLDPEKLDFEPVGNEHWEK